MPRTRCLRYARLAGLLLPLWLAGPVAPAMGQRATRSKASGTSSPRTARSGAKAKRAPARPARAAAVAALRHSTPRGLDALRHDLGALLGSRTRHGNWGVMVTSLTRGDTLFRQAPDHSLVPASTMKLFTSALALERLGAEHLFHTEVLRDGTVDAAGTLRGSLVLRGEGDPSLSTRFIRGGPSAPMDLLARQTAAVGIRRVTGDLIADATAFESRRIPEGWLSRYAGAGYAAPFSALSLNENIVIVGVSPGGSGSTGRVALEPASSELSIANAVRTVSGRASRIRVVRVGENRVVVSGTIGERAGTQRYQLVVGDPVTFTAGAFRSALAAQGVTVEGTIRVARTPASASVVTTLPSPPLARLVSTMNRESINLVAEQLYRAAARGTERREIGSAEVAGTVLQDYLVRRVGTSREAVRATDGSGLSVLDRVTPRALVQLLAHAHRAPWGSAFHASLPVAGQSELLRHRMRATPAQGNLHAKTGTTNEVVGLAGYVTAENGEILAFAFLYNGKDRWRARETIDAMGPTMAAFSRD